MDILIIAMMSLDNTFVYMQFHPLTYIVKLNIEMSMATLITKIAKSAGTSDHIIGSSYDKSRSHGTSRPQDPSHSSRLSHMGQPAGDAANDNNGGRGKFWGTITTIVELSTMKSTTPPDSKNQLRLNHNNTDKLISQEHYRTSYSVATDHSDHAYRNGATAGSSHDSTNSTTPYEAV
ncbi:hypothetical protein S7711_08430 [Stachybotrys chartarum IBT 7711]|uniref:Uncharacterized protein n=1 Tax=Stachybotrys chartarum (strain CBS 109288 / IBT 7711) TaxID=1280523 RepID=A0A084BAT5_STACB|nr:hypothetical protein S7711_08430 [Stachybotrys chartarum IBT 7711]